MLDVLTGPNAIHPDWLTPEERLLEIAEILSDGLMRYRNRLTETVEQVDAMMGECKPSEWPQWKPLEPSSSSSGEISVHNDRDR